jgi:crossover junction endodeoxyribonuclease RuvC
MRLLSLDLATKSGFCVGNTPDVERFGTHVLPSSGEDVGKFLSSFDKWLREFLFAERVTFVCFEAPVLPRRTTVATVRKLMAIAGLTEMICAQIGLSCREANLSTVKKFWTGDGRADKAAMMKMARVYGFEPADDNQADALALFHYAGHILAPKGSRAALGPLGASAR